MGRSPCCDKSKVKRGTWSPEEDATLRNYLNKHGTTGNWISLPQKAGLRRCGKSCRLRWLNYLRPDIKHGPFTQEEQNIICNLYNRIGSRWSVIASQLPGRTDNDVKNFWNTKLKKKLIASTTNYETPAATTTTTITDDTKFSHQAPQKYTNAPTLNQNSPHEPTTITNFNYPTLINLDQGSSDFSPSQTQDLVSPFRPMGFGVDENYGISTDDEVMSGFWSQEEQGFGGYNGNSDLYSIFQS